MTSLIGDFVERVDFNSYEDFFKNFEPCRFPQNVIYYSMRFNYEKYKRL